MNCYTIEIKAFFYEYLALYIRRKTYNNLFRVTNYFKERFIIYLHLIKQHFTTFKESVIKIKLLMLLFFENISKCFHNELSIFSKFLGYISYQLKVFNLSIEFVDAKRQSSKGIEKRWILRR